MTLPTGTISLSQVNTELGKSSTATISLNDSAVRSLAGKTSGTISMNDLRGKSASVTASMVVGQASAFYKSCALQAEYGFLKEDAGGCGSTGSLTSNILNGKTITQILNAYGTIQMHVTGNHSASSILNTMNFDGVTLSTSGMNDAGTDPSSWPTSYNTRLYRSSTNTTELIWYSSVQTIPDLSDNVGQTLTVTFT